MTDTSKVVVVNSPPGSGGIFCRELIRNNFDVRIVWPLHYVEKFQKNDINICVVRNPYDAISSSFEVGYQFMPEEYKEFYMDDIDFTLSLVVPRHLSDYYRFMAASKRLDYVTPVSFEFLTEQPDKFLSHISKKFDLAFKPQYKNADIVKSLIANTPETSTRVPREKTEFRKKIEEHVNNYEPIKHAYQEYLLYKEDIQSTENML